MAGNEFVYFSMADKGDPDFLPFWKRIQEAPHETVVNSVEEGLDRIEREQDVLHVQAGQVINEPINNSLSVTHIHRHREKKTH